MQLRKLALITITVSITSVLLYGAFTSRNFSEVIGTTQPATCTIGDIAYDTDDEITYRCTATDTWTASGGGIAASDIVIPPDTYANLPAAGTAGRLFLTTNSVYTHLYDNGVTWDHFFVGHQVYPPVLGDFAWVNQGGATAITTNGGIHLNAPATASHSMRVLKQAAPATPYTITVAFIGNHQANSILGIGWRQSSDGKMVSLDMGSSSDNKIAVRSWTSVTAFNFNYYVDSTPINWGNISLWFRITDNGTNRISSISWDGITFQQKHSIGRTDFMTGDEVMFFVNTNGATADAGMNIISWNVE